MDIIEFSYKKNIFFADISHFSHIKILCPLCVVSFILKERKRETEREKERVHLLLSDNTALFDYRIVISP